MEPTFPYLLVLVSCILVKPAASECKLKERTLKEGEQFENCTQKCGCAYGSLSCQPKEPPQCPSAQFLPTSRCLQYNTRVSEGQCCPVPFCEKCADRWYGDDCSKKCGRCASDRCDISSGVCTPNKPLCLPGFVGDMCTEPLAKCILENSTLLHGETYKDCGKHCTCNFGAISCVSACPPSVSLPSEDCPNPQYRIPEGQCCRERFCDPCPDGRYGVGCSQVCGQCAAGTCNISTGVCTPHNPPCLPGYFGEKCSNSCPEGKYGRSCFGECGKCAGGNAQCNVITGFCLMDSPKCLPGWKGNTCWQKCSDGFFGPDCLERCGACATGQCSPQTGICKPDEPLCKSGYSGDQCKEVCPLGRFGPGCAWECGGCATGRTSCKPQTGECPEAEPRCTPGHTGELCKACGAGTWGQECQQNCSNNCARGDQECDRRDGTCIGGCLPGFYGSLCEPAQSTMQLSTVVGIGVGIGLFILAIIVICTMIYLYCNQRKARKNALSRRDSYLSPVALNNGKAPSRGLPDVYRTGDYEIPLSVRNESIPVYCSPDPSAFGSMDLHGEEDELIYEMMLPRTNWNVSLADMDVSNTVMTQGNFGESRLALWNHNVDKSLCTHVGLKRFPGNGSDQRKNLINGELEKLRSLDRCISVLAVLGTSTDPNTGDRFLILECTERGSLLTYLKQNRSESSEKEELTEKRLTKLCQDVANGMEHISSYSITNVDLAAETVLLDKYLNAKITGIVHFQEEDQTIDKIRERQRWDAMETLADGQHTVHSDVWRYGVLMWEVFSLGETPYSDISVQDLHHKLESGCRLGHPACTSTMAYVLMTECWNADPTSRPSFTAVLSRIRDIRKGVPLSHDLVSHRESGLYWTAE